jgi:hypothetical protein
VIQNCGHAWSENAYELVSFFLLFCV